MCPTIAVNAPVGVMDSGVGGLSVLKHLARQLPNEHFTYFADSAHAPYGNKTATEIQQRCFEIAETLIAQGAKTLVVACNTATAAAIGAMRQHYTLPIVGMEPAVKPAAAASKNGIIGVLATTGTLQSAQFAALLEHYGQQVQVITQACIGLVECIEQGQLDTPHTQALLRQYCQPLMDAGADTVVLGCTHYPFVRAHIQAIVGPAVTLIDTGAAVAKRLHQVLAEKELLNTANEAGDFVFLTSGTQATQRVMHTLWNISA
ncbi:glutamate racemase [Methylophilus medardicus]|uniref:Glutamate racemase n=1 Tax=Methylophilus medardicus TaxID=2588534 RepID=A0A5B8CUA2_9PROT|nr:glutamate racemase [Methylophilus medardicus]QDC44833.1 glutamate racemase [Methylophilus medardicus]QDC49840.1 glutamate racemase [Methylophilus medardicus]QDC53545.1 glutamate racemase [Methylophilus medardicus]